MGIAVWAILSAVAGGVITAFLAVKNRQEERLNEESSSAGPVWAQTEDRRPVALNKRFYQRFTKVAIGIIVIIGSLTPLYHTIPHPILIPEWLKLFGIWTFYFVLMLLGMTGQYMWGLKTFSKFRWDEFLRPLWVSIIVFAPFWAGLAVKDINYGAAVAAYQSGFFWKVIFDHPPRAASNR